MHGETVKKKTLRHVSISYEIILREFVISLLRLLSFNLLSCEGFTVVMRQHVYGISALCALRSREWDCSTVLFG